MWLANHIPAGAEVMFRTITCAFVSFLSLLFFCTTVSAAAPLAGIGLSGSFAHVIGPVAFKCGMVNGKLVCGNTKGNENRGDDDDDDDDRPKKSKDKVIPKTCGKKVNCEAGFVKLEKPNKYGACCEAREGLPPPKQQEAEKCKFPGEVGAPNCHCPKGTTFLGYKGCVANPHWTCTGMVKDRGPTHWTERAVSEADARASVLQQLKSQNRTLVGSLSCSLN